MDGQLFTKVFVSAIGFLCCVLFWIIGFLEGRKEKPANLFSGVRLSPEQVENIRAYNHAVGRLWKCWAIPFGLSGLLALPGGGFLYGALILEFLSGTAGAALVLRRMFAIQKKYIRKP